MSTAIIIFITLGILSFPILIIKNKLEKRNGNFSKLTKDGKLFFNELEKIRDNNEIMNRDDLVILFNNLTKKQALNLQDVYELSGINKLEDSKEGSNEEKLHYYATDLVFNLQRRYGYFNNRINGKSAKESFDEHGINLKDNEILYDKLSRVDLWEEKTTSTNYMYGGMSYSFGKSAKFYVGSRNVNKIEIRSFIPIDRGDLFTTNQRIIFIGKEKNTNKTISIDNILQLNVDDNSAIIGIPNGKKPMFKFENYQNSLEKRDHLFRFVAILDRIVQKTQDQNCK